MNSAILPPDWFSAGLMDVPNDSTKARKVADFTLKPAVARLG